MNDTAKKIVLVILASIAGLLLLAALAWFIFLSTQFSVYQDDRYKFSIKYPHSWKLIVHPKTGAAVVFLRPKDTALDLIRENFNVTIQPLPEDISTLAAFTARVKKQMLGVFGGGMKLVEDKPVYWGWREGHQIAMDEIPPNHLRVINAWVFRRNDVCILTFLGDMKNARMDNILVREMISSFRMQ